MSINRIELNHATIINEPSNRVKVLAWSTHDVHLIHQKYPDWFYIDVVGANHLV